MTFKQIEQILIFKKQVKESKGLDDIRKIEAAIKNFFTDKYNVKLKYINCFGEYMQSYFDTDKIALESFLDGLIASESKIGIVDNIIDVLEEGKTLSKDKLDIKKYICKVYYAYNNDINFDDNLKLIVTAPDDVVKIGQVQVDKSIVEGILIKLKNYAINICEEKLDEKENTFFKIYNNSTASLNNNININVDNLIKNAYEQVEELSLSSLQEKDVLDKLKDIENIVKKENKRKVRWEKLQSIMKWLAEQGIQVAGILIPILAQVIKL